MSDTKALEQIVTKWLWLETLSGAWIFQGVPPIDQAAAELAQLREELDGANKRCKGMARYFREIEKHLQQAPCSITPTEYEEITDCVDAEFAKEKKSAVYLAAHPEVTK